MLIWSSQLAANDFPPICAMTGAPAETWRKFRFATAPGWAYLFLLLLCTGVGLLIVFILISVVSRRATGHLPLTKATSQNIGLATWIPAGLIIGTVAVWIVAAVVGGSSNDETSGAIAAVLVIVGFLALIAGTIGWAVVRPLVRPRGKVMEQLPGQPDKLVELRRLHPAFVAAVNQMNQARAAHYASLQQPAGPLLPESN